MPAPATCYARDRHTFASQEIWASGDAPGTGKYCPILAAEPWTVVCDGTKERGWYRASNIFHHRTAEWPIHNKPPISNLSVVKKPIRTNCDCFEGIEGYPSFLRVGRYGEWRKGVLSHHAYEKVKKEIWA